MTEKDTGLYIKLDTLGNYARNTALAIDANSRISGKYIAANIRSVLTHLKRKVQKCAESEVNLGGAAEWLGDNWYIAEREGKNAIYQLKNCGKFPAASGSKRARISEAALALIHSGRGELTPERIELFLSEYQKVAVLTEKELNFLVPVLMAELISFLDIMTDEIWGTGNKDDIELIIKNIFTSLRLISSLDITDVLKRVNRIEAELMRDPSGIYPLMDDDTKNYYRRVVAGLAKKNRMTELQVAQKVISLAESSEENHVGFYIFKKPLGKQVKESDGSLYIVSIVVISLFFAVLSGILLSSVWAAVVLLIPISEIVKNLVDFIAVRTVKPKRLPRMKFENGLPKQGRTLCVISTILGSEKDGKKYAGLLEEYMLLNRDSGENLFFGILADFPELDKVDSPSDAACVKSAADEIDKLNREYGNRFYLFIRKREYNKADNIYMARERKRGAILELVRKLSGKESMLVAVKGDESALKGISYIITLDSDTRLTAGSALELVGTAMHPLNVPVLDGDKGRVVSGYGILQPRVSVDLESANKSDFTKIFAGQGGVDPYGSVSSDVYQDLFGFGSFSGKGLINVPVYEACLDGTFPDNMVLSHDLLEGSYLRCGYISDIELTDGFPYKVTSYFARMNRWTRGDWQNIQWLGQKVKDQKGEVRENPLNDIDKWKIFDNFRRSLAPVMTFAALFAGMLISKRAFSFAAVIAIISQLSGLLLSSAVLVFKHDGSTKARYQSTIISGAAGAIMQTLIKLMLLPAEAWTQFSAICTAMYRLRISHRKMLAWVTASDSEKKYGNTVLINYLKLGACFISGVIILIAASNAAVSAVGIIWMFTPAYAWALSRECTEEWGISQQDREFLTECAADIWRYFEAMICQEDNFLPPDNFQEEPAIGKAHRTSPTNMGLALISVLSAFDLGLISREQASEKIEKMLDSINSLSKWNGHLYNWYDTKTMQPLEPKYVSTVDSGNLAACLIILKEAADELENNDIKERCKTLAENMDFKPLFDKKRKLFYIGWDMMKNEPTEGWYDLLTSEARTTSYIAIALGEAPRKHWRRLGRALVSLDNYSGMASWTGTMFEYLMPNLILPCYKNSLLYESSHFCIYAQRKANTGIPWGISESAFYSYDPGMAYSYKAHGVQRLALKRKMDLEKVIAPYASFLALGLEPKAAIKNLRYLKDLGAVGKYGYYEALDFTPSRQTDKKFEIVRTYMVHHLGMSLMAIDNALSSDIMTRRFMRDKRMNAYRELLQEKVPTGEVVLRQPPREVPEKPRRQENEKYFISDNKIDAFSPRCIPLSNGRYSVLVAENGKTKSTWMGKILTNWDKDVLRANGMELYLKVGDRIISLLPAPLYEKEINYSFSFTGASGSIEAKDNDFCSKMTVTVPAAIAGEIRTVELSCNDKLSHECNLICVFEPVLDSKAAYDSHPAFSRLCLEAVAEGNSLIIRRRPGGGKKEAFMCISCDCDVVFATSAERGVFPESAEFKKSSPEMRISCSVPVRFTGGKAKIRFSLCSSEAREEAVSSAKALLTKEEVQTISRFDASALMLGLNAANARQALSFIPALYYQGVKRSEREKLILDGNYCKKDLWRFGISGDYPIIAVSVNSNEEIEQAVSIMREHAFLNENGVECDLALLLTDGSDYRCAQRRAATDFLNRSGREYTLGSSRGVFLMDAYGERVESVIALANVYVNLSHEEAANEIERAARFPFAQKYYLKKRDGMLAERFDDENEFKVAIQRKLPPVSWFNVLANKDFGYIASDAGTGHMWYKNAHEMKINRWLNDPITTVGSERLELLRDGERISLFADGQEYPTMLTYGFGYMMWEREISGTKIKLTAFVPLNTAARVFVIESDGIREGDKISYYTDIILGEGNVQSSCMRSEYLNGIISVWDPASSFGNTRFSLAASIEPECFTTDRDAYLTESLDRKTGAGFNMCVAAVYKAENRLVIVTGCDNGGAIKGLCDYEAAIRNLNDTKAAWKKWVKPIVVDTPDSDLNNYINGWALYQTYGCRITARTSIYQNGGAYGFRDQLQDVMALTPFMPEITAEQIRIAAEHQYLEGDVQHWWHSMPDGDRGVRTRISDDLLWLPMVLCDYVFRTGDYSICRVKAPYLVSEQLRPDETDRYESPITSDLSESVYEHAKRAVNKFIDRGTGTHDLALIGSGDWNDGMNCIGADGKGESVWLSWFGSIVLEKMSRLCTKEGEKEEAKRYDEYSAKLKRAAEKAWDGEWFLRGYYDNGESLGTSKSEACRIDSIAQSFSVFAGVNSEMSKTAIKSAYNKLYDRENRVVKLFDPAFSESETDPGYIKGYCPGFRENGGQYTHGAVWLGMALLEEDMKDEGYEIIHALLPGGRNEEVYKAEPFVISADVYSNEDNIGRSGWSWYTGAAGWMYRVITEYLLGLRVRDGRLYIEPKIPDSWNECNIDYRIGDEYLHIKIGQAPGRTITVNDKAYDSAGYSIKIHNNFIFNGRNM